MCVGCVILQSSKLAHSAHSEVHWNPFCSKLFKLSHRTRPPRPGTVNILKEYLRPCMPMHPRSCTAYQVGIGLKQKRARCMFKCPLNNNRKWIFHHACHCSLSFLVLFRWFSLGKALRVPRVPCPDIVAFNVICRLRECSRKEQRFSVEISATFLSYFSKHKKISSFAVETYTLLSYRRCLVQGTANKEGKLRY